jgi:hypothetical protein
MRRFAFTAFLLICLAVCSPLGIAQTQTFTSAGIEYELELPSQTWHVVSQPDSVHQHAEFIYGDRNDGYLRIRKEVVDAGTAAADVARKDQDQRLRFQPGYVEGKEERFAGRLAGVTISYEYTYAGKAMAGRNYYLQADNRTFYTLRFTAYKDKLPIIRNQTDLIARSFHLK